MASGGLPGRKSATPGLHPAMTPRLSPRVRLRTALLGATLAVCAVRAEAAKPAPAKKPAAPPPTAAKPVAPPAPRSAVLKAEDWQRALFTRLEPGEIDRLVAKELAADKIEAAPLTSDEQFLRRVSLDLTGQLPLPADVTEFAADRDPQKRAKVIDRLLASDEF